MVKEIKKAKINSGGLEVEYKDYIANEDYTKDITLKCSQTIHKDLRIAFDMLKPHVVCICEFPESDKVSHSTLNSIHEEIANIAIMGFTTGGSDDSAGACIIAQRILESGKVLNVVTPFIPFSSEDYAYSAELDVAIQGCEYEVKQYLENAKFGVKQTSIDFDSVSEEKLIAEAENTGESVSELKKNKAKISPRRKKPKVTEEVF